MSLTAKNIETRSIFLVSNPLDELFMRRKASALGCGDALLFIACGYGYNVLM